MEEKKKAIRKYREKQSPISWLLDAIGLSSKTWYAIDQEVDDSDDLLWKERIEHILIDFPYYGFRRVHAQLCRLGHLVNKKRVQRIMHKHALVQKRRKWSVKTTNSRHALPIYPNLVADLVIDYPEQVWVADITYIRLPDKRFCYLATVIDVYTRRVRGWALMETMEESLVLGALNAALTRYGAPEYFHSDRGGQYCGKAHTGLLTTHKVGISMSATGVSVDNPFAESFFRTLKVEEVYLSDYADIEEARRSIAEFIDVVYTQKRLHSSLRYLTPEEFEQAYEAQHKKKGRAPLLGN